jgi:hypothetical protein
LGGVRRRLPTTPLNRLAELLPDAWSLAHFASGQKATVQT